MISIRVKNYCSEDISKIENYDEAVSDTTQTWQCHHKLEIQNGISISPSELKKQNLYYNRPASELIFLTEEEHKRLHGFNQRDETKNKISEKHKELWQTEERREKSNWIGKHPWNYGKTSPQKGKKKSPETIQRMKDAKKEWWENHKINEDEHNRRKAGGRKAIEKSRDKLKEYGKMYSKMYKGKHWKIIDGKRVWYDL